MVGGSAYKLDHFALAADCSKCLEKLRAERADVIPLLDQCAGFVLMISTKAALVAGIERGAGVLVARIGTDEHGRAIFSAPVPMQVTKVGVGISLGMEKLYTLMLLKTPEAVMQVAETEVAIGADVDVPVAMRGTCRTVVLGSTSHTADLYCVSSGLMLADLSLNGGAVEPSYETASAMYGKGSLVKDVLAGKHQPPAEFADMYRFLGGLGAKLHSDA
mmetsp:Transcript_20282/g.51352  ORF Transcript_20282/g.51352 Transcript_20282/m.51352 type:complete len:218 (-) Transcript_20282:129-782(-)|eukprot:CAMPEP_0202860722 /NCGR_PEP_ID=MMETSP1391-20130828/2343_1 /ASSEMBLY_ACC=CAM_ASM_000867 /TAXON_ID=1034604 /ORGANISM="Chlamydomonas leiostraca, Strain SAG 11-49" /LENGTH=217 /DNA_ID=CAMNT_0049539955 /DNA_START=41 /DNA_END=694 /DNA_ORIENTATION=-